ncbi:LacI family DNA-binding transcriptional regulator [Ancrocorticia populi]|uniref:LacI family DNA-binding transcriptional regulator n=1 Tax=Ancrocorticia populi TaxID=2175228 RepID=UPI001401E624|nr:LacI family DNA-binding transcriptional regulator [Ancrocorticia populi]
MAKRVTLADIACHTGLSAATVSMALNERPESRIPERTAERVRTAAAELGYTPDVNARGLRTGRTDAIGFVSDEVTLTRYASAMIRGLLDESARRGFAVMMAEAETDSAKQDRAVKALLERRIDGLIFGQMRAHQIELPSLDIRVPIVLINGTAPGMPAVLPDEYQAGRDAANYLIQHGHKKIAMIGRSSDHQDPTFSATIPERMRGIDDVLEGAGLSLTQEVYGSGWEPEFGYEGTLRILDSSEITGLIAANDRVAFGALQAAQVRGLSVPDDLSIMSFDDELLATYVHPQLTTMRLPYQEMGEIGMQLLADAITNRTALEPETVLVPMPLVERESVRQIAG